MVCLNEMKETIFTGKKKEEGFKIYRRAEMQKLLDSVDIGTELEILIRKKKKKRTLPQNALFHVYVDIISKEIGMSREWVKNHLKEKFLTVTAKNICGEILINKQTGEVMTEVRDTSSLTISEMIEFCENIRIYVMDFGIYLEKPNEQGELTFTDL